MNFLYLQSGGPTAQINSSLMGGILEVKKDPSSRIFGALNGIEGLLDGKIIELTSLSHEELSLLGKTNGAILGSSRKSMAKASQEEFQKALQNLVKFKIDALLINGGNDSMLTCIKMHEALKDKGISVIGVPKTVDNDLFGIPFSPGYLTAANYVANAIQSIILDSKVYKKGKVTLIETMGRETGWLAASAFALPKKTYPDGIYLPETGFDLDEFIAKAKRDYQNKGYAFYVFSEGSSPKEGDAIDSFGNRAVEGYCDILAEQIKQKEDLPIRVVRLSIPQRSSNAYPNALDKEIATFCGSYAIRLALSKQSGFMAGYELDKDGQIKEKKIALEEVAAKTRYFDSAYIPLLKTYININPCITLEEIIR